MAHVAAALSTTGLLLLVLLVGSPAPAAAQLPYYPDEPPPQPYVLVNSTWNRTGYDDDLRGQPLPTGQWWVDFADPTGKAAAVNILPLLARKTNCGLQIGAPLVARENVGRRFKTDFNHSLEVRANQDVIEERCETVVGDYTDMSVLLRHRIIGGTLQGQGLESVMVRGSPYILIRPVGTALPFIRFPEQIRSISNIRINVPISVEASLLNITTENGKVWLIQFPEIVKMTVDRFSVKIDEVFLGYMRIMYVPADANVGKASRYLIDNSACAAIAGKVQASVNATSDKVMTRFVWTAKEDDRTGFVRTDCTPLVFTTVAHRRAWTGGWIGHLVDDAPVVYETIMGTLIPPRVAVNFDMEYAIAPELFEEDANELQLAEKYWLYSQAIKDRDGYLGDIKEDSNNASGADALLHARAREFYGLGKLYRIARRLEAVKLGLDIAGRMNELLDTMTQLAVYDSRWGGYVPSPPGRLLSELVNDNYEDQTKTYGQILYGFAQLFDVAPGGLEGNPTIPGYKLNFVNAILRSVMSPGEGAAGGETASGFYPALRNYDWYTGLSLKGGLTTDVKQGRLFEDPSYGMLCWAGARKAARVLLQPAAEDLAEILYTVESAATSAYWLEEGAAVGTKGSGVVSRNAYTVDTADTLVSFFPLGDHLSPLLPTFRKTVLNVQRVRVLLATPPEKAAEYEYPEFLNSDGLMAAMTNGSHITQYFENGVRMNETLELSSAMVLEWAILTADPDGAANVTDLFKTWRGFIPFRVEGRQFWYNESFNYQMRAVTYYPTVIGRDPVETNIYGGFYADILNRDLDRIKAIGFNTIKIRWFDTLSPHGLKNFFERAKDRDLGVILTLVMTKDEVLNNRHFAEDRLVTAIDILGDNDNLLIWNLESPSFAEISVKDTYEYMTLFRQLKRLRTKFDAEYNRPIMVSVYPFFFNELIVGGQNPVDIYTEGIEVIEMQTNELNLTDTKLMLEKIDHPVLIDLVTDSLQAISELQAQDYRSSLLRNMTEKVLDLHKTHDSAGVVITEWVDQYWRGETTNNDNDCPDPSPGRLSQCATRILDFNDGEINSEHQGLNEQVDTWMRHCIRPKESFFVIAELFTGNSTEFREKYDGESCIFVFLETFWQWVVGVGTLIVIFFSFVLAFAAWYHRAAVKKRAESRGAQAGTRWCQPDIMKISKTVVTRTCTIVHTQKAFERIAIQGHDEHDKLRAREITPISGEWCGEVMWSIGEEVKEISLQLQFSSMPNNVGFTIQGSDSGKKYRILGTARKYNSPYLHDKNADGEELVGERHLIDFTARNIAPDEDEDGEENLEFVGVWEKYRVVNPDTGEATTYEYIEGGDEYDFEDLESGCRVVDGQMNGPRVFTGSFHIEPQPEVDPWNYNRWQCLLMQLERLQMLIYDEIMCQGRWGTEQKHQETDAAFDFAVDTLHFRYLHNFHGWVKQQGVIGGIVDIPEVHTRKRTDEQLTELLGLLTIWQLGEHNTWFAGHWLSWNLHYFLKFKRFPPTFVMSDPRHFCETPLTFDDINESCCLIPYWDVPHQCTNKCPDVCRIAEQEEGRMPAPKLLLPDGNYDVDEQQQYPFFKTFREPRRWGVIFFMLHDGFFILHTTTLLFLFWGLTMHFSEVGERGIGDVITRSIDVYKDKQDESNFIILVLCKADFWLLVLHELLDLWLLSGIIQSPAMGVIGTRCCKALGAFVCFCRCCGNTSAGQGKQNEDDREISCQTFWTTTTCKRIRLLNFVRLRWSAYLSMIIFASLLGSTLFGDDSDPDTGRMAAYVAVRLSGLVAFNILITIFPVTLPGTPEAVKAAEVDTGKLRKFIVSLLYWAIIYFLAFVFQGFIMYKTEGTGFDFCDCEGLRRDVEFQGATGFAADLGEKIMICGRDQPRCFTAVSLIWVSTAVIFAMSVQGGFLLGVLFVGGIKHLLLQWDTRKSRQIKGHKMETKFILSAINVKLLTFSDPRDNQLARRVWNKVISVMHEEDLLSNYECETLQIYTHTVDLTFSVENGFAKERIGAFLEYISTSTHFEDTLGPIQCYPAVTVIVPVYGEGVMADRHMLRIKARADHQQQSQLHFLTEHYWNEWENFVERAVNEMGMFKQALQEDLIIATLQDKSTLEQEFDYVKKRALKPDDALRKVCAQRVLDTFHCRPRQFTEEEYNQIWWWASMRMQTVARTIRGIERNREANKFLLELEADYTQSPKLNKQYIDTVATDKLQVIIAFQNLANNKWYEANKQGIRLVWSIYPKFQVVYDIVTGDFRMAPDVYQKTTHKMRDLWDCMENASCLALWDAAAGDWYVDRVVGRRNKLRMAKSDNVKWSLPGAMQGKAVNQAHCLPFARGQVVQAVDCNQDGYFEESLKLRTLLAKFFPSEDRKWSTFKVVGHPEYVMSLTSGTVGRYAGYAEYIFNTMFQRVLSVLGARMHYGHPDYFDASWIVTQSGLSKPNPRVNLNEDIFAGYHIKAQNQHVLHIDDMKSGKGRETNFDGAMSFEHKLGMGAAMQFRTRDVFELSRYSNILDRHSIIFGSIAAYIYMGLVFMQIFLSLLLHMALAVAGKTDYDLLSEGSPYGTEWMLQMTLVETLPLGAQLILDYGLWGLFQWVWDIGGVTWFYMFVFTTKYHAFWKSVFDGNAVYVATGRSDPLFRRSFRHVWRMYGHTHIMYGALLLAICIMYVNIHPRGSWKSFIRTIFHWILAFGLIVTPVSHNPSLTVGGLIKDLMRFFSWVWGEAIMKVKDADFMLGDEDKKKIDKKAMVQLFNKLVKRTRAEQRDGTTVIDDGFYSDEDSYWEEEETGSTESTLIDEDDPHHTSGLKLGGPLPKKRRGSGSDGTTTTSSRSRSSDSPRKANSSSGGKVAIPTLGGVKPAQVESASSVSESYTSSSGTPAQGGGAAPINRRMKGAEEEDYLDDITVQDFLDRGASQHHISMLEEIFDKLDMKQEDSACDGWLDVDQILRGFLHFGVKVKEADIQEHLNALQLERANFFHFALLYFIMHDSNAQLESYGIAQAIENLPPDKLNLIVKHQDETRRKSLGAGVTNSKDAQAEAYVQFAFNLRRSEEVKTVKFYDSTHFIDRIRAESLLHHYKVCTILEYRGTSTTGRFLWTLVVMAAWCFVYFALWQDIMWEVLYLLMVFFWEYVVCLPDVVPVVILTRVFVHVWVIIRLLLLLGTGKLFQTLFITYWFIHAVIHIKLSFWAAYGPYLIGRERFKNPQIEAQREECLIMMLKSSRERYLFAFPYYMFMRRVVAMFMVLFQFFFCLLLLIVQALIRMIKWLLWNIGSYFRRKSATSTTYVAARTAEDIAEDHERRAVLSFCMQTQTDGAETRGTQVEWGGRGVGAGPGGVSPARATGGTSLLKDDERLDEEEWPIDWIDLAYPDRKPAEWLPKALENELLPVDWLEIANGGSDVPPEWLDFAPPTKDQPWAKDTPPNWPENVSWPPPRPKAKKSADDDIPAEWLNVLLQNPDPDPEFLKLALDNEMDPVNWLRMGCDDDMPPEWMSLAPDEGGSWPEQRPKGWKENMPWPPPKPKAKPYNELPNAWLKPIVDPDKGKGKGKGKKMSLAASLIDPEDDITAMDILGSVWEGDNDTMPESWKEALPENNRGMWGERRPANFPEHLQWPPPRKCAIPRDLPHEWLHVAFKRGFDDDKIDMIRDGVEMDPVEWLEVAHGPGKDIPDDCMEAVPPPGGEWPEERPKSYPEDAPWPPPKPAGYEDNEDFEWIKLAMEDDSLTPEMLQAAMNGDLDPAEWLRIGNGEDIPPEWLDIIPQPLQSWGPRPKGYPATAPWPPPKPVADPVKRPKSNDVDPDWLQVAFDKNLPPHVLKKAINNELEPAEWLKLAAGDDMDPQWLNLLTDPDHANTPPENYPKNLPWPPPKPLEKPRNPQETKIRGMRQKKLMQGLLKKKAFQDMLKTHDLDPEVLKVEATRKGGTAGLKPKYLTMFPFIKKAADGDMDPEWLEHVFDKNADNARALELGLMDPEPNWLKLGVDGDIDPEWIALSAERDPKRPKNYPQNAPWPPPAPENPEIIQGLRKRKVRKIAKELLDTPAFNEMLATKGLDPDEVRQKLEKLCAEDDEDVEMLRLGADDDLTPELLMLFPFLAAAAKGDADPALIKAAMERNPDRPGELMAAMNEEDPEWLELAFGDDLDPTWIALAKDPNSERPANYPAGHEWPPNRGALHRGRTAGLQDDDESDVVPSEWLQLAFDLGANQDALRKAANGEVEPVDWLRLACGEEPDPVWLRTDSLGEFPKERPEGYPEDMPWPPPKASGGARREMDPKWIEMCFDKGLQKNVIKRAATGELGPAEWLKLLCDDEVDPTWVKMAKNGTQDRPVGYPAKLPWPVPRQGATCGKLNPEWVKVLFEQGLPRSVLKRGATDQLDPAEWIKLCSGDDPEPEWLAVDKFGNYAERRPADYPANLPWPPPRPFENELDQAWTKLAAGNAHKGGRIAGLPSDQLKRAINGEMTPAEWIELAVPEVAGNVPEEWLEKNDQGEYYERPPGYPTTAPWPPPKPRARAKHIPAEWATIATRDFPDEALRKIAAGEMEPAEWLQLATDQDPEPEWLHCDAAGRYADEAPASYPGYLPWPPPKPMLVEDVIDPEWLQIAMRPGVRPQMRKRALENDLEPAEWLKLAIGGEPDPTWLKLNKDGEYPKHAPATYPRHVLPWPPPKPKRRLPESAAADTSVDGDDDMEVTMLALGANDDIAVEWMKLAMASDLPPETKQRALRGELGKEEWLKLAMKDDEVDPDWLADGTAGGRPAGYPEDLPWPPPAVGKEEDTSRHAQRQEKRAIEWIELAAKRAENTKQFKRAVNQEMSAAEWLALANDNKQPPATWLKEPYTAPRPADYPKNQPWPPPLPADALKENVEMWRPDWLDLHPLEDNEMEWLKIAMASDCPPELKKKALRRELERADWLKIGRSDDYDLPIDWMAIPEENAKAAVISGTRKRVRIPRPRDYPKHLPWPPPKSAPRLITGQELQRRTLWLTEAVGQERYDVVRLAMKGQITTKEWVQIQMPAGQPLRWNNPPVPVSIDDPWEPTKPRKYPDDAPWPPPRPRPLDEAEDFSWKKINSDEFIAARWIAAVLKSEAPYEVKQAAVQLTLKPEDYIKYALGEDKSVNPNWMSAAEGGVKVRGKDGRPIGYPAHLPWPPPEVQQSADRSPRSGKEDELRAEWYNRAAQYAELTGRKDVFKQALRGELTAEDWIGIAIKTSMGAQYPIQTAWLKPETQDGMPTMPPSGYPIEAAWPPLEVLTKANLRTDAGGQKLSLPSAWLELALEKKLDAKRLIDAQNLRLPPLEWFKLALDGHPPSPSWFDAQFADGTWQKNAPVDYPANLPWPPPPHLVDTPRRKRKSGKEAVGWYASGRPADKRTDGTRSEGSSSLCNKAEVPVEWLKLAAASLPAAKLQAAYHGDLSAQEWLAVATKGGPVLVHWLDSAPRAVRDRWAADRPQGYPADAPWPPPLPREARRRAYRKAPTADGASTVSRGTKEGQAERLVPQEWLTLAVAYARTRQGTNAEYLSSVLNNDVPPSEWLRMAQGGGDLPTAWLSYVPGIGQKWPKRAPADFPDHCPWPPPQPKKAPTFKCEAWEDIEDDEDLAIEIPALPSDLPPAAAAAAAPAPQAIPESLVYFKHNVPGEDSKVVTVDANLFQTVQEFRSGIRQYFNFRGGVEQVLLQMRKKGDFMDLEELENNHHWPIPTSVDNPILITIFDLNKKKGADKKTMKITGGQLKGLQTEMGRRARQVREKGIDEKIVGRGGGLSILPSKREPMQPGTARPSARGGGGARKREDMNSPTAAPALPPTSDVDATMKSALKKDKRDAATVGALGLKFDLSAVAPGGGLKVMQVFGVADGKLLPGDCVMAINGAPVMTVQDVQAAVANRPNLKAALNMDVNHANGKKSTVALQPGIGPKASFRPKTEGAEGGDKKRVGFG